MKLDQLPPIKARPLRQAWQGPQMKRGRKRPTCGQLSFREVSKEPASGFLNERDKPYAAKSVASMLR